MADGQQPVGPLGAIHTEVIRLSPTVTVLKDTVKEIKFLEEALIKKYAETRVMVGISNINIWCSGTVHASLVPDSWTNNTITNFGSCPVVATNSYHPTTDVPFIPYISQQLKPKILVGEPPVLILLAPNEIKVIVSFDLHLHGVAPVKI